MILRTLTRIEMRWANAAFSAIFPRATDGETRDAPGICDLDLEGFLRNILLRVPLEPALGLRVAIWIVALAPLFVLRRVATIHGLAPKDRERVVAALIQSRIYAVRQLVLALKAIGAMLYGNAPAVRARMAPPRSQSAFVPLRLPPASQPVAQSPTPAGVVADEQRSVA